MRRFVLSALVVLCALTAVHVRSASSQTEPAKTRPTYLVVYKQGPAWIQGKPLSGQQLREHGRYMLSLYLKGTLKSAGPFRDDTGGAVLFEAADDAEAKAIVTADPAVVNGVFVGELLPWTLVDWNQRAKAAAAKK